MTGPLQSGRNSMLRPALGNRSLSSRPAPIDDRARGHVPRAVLAQQREGRSLKRTSSPPWGFARLSRGASGGPARKVRFSVYESSPTLKRWNLRTVMFSPNLAIKPWIIRPTVVEGSLTNGWSTSTISS